MKTEKEIFEKVKEYLFREEGESDVKMKNSFSWDFNMTSLDKIELCIKLEREFGIEIPDETAMNFELVEDLIKYIQKELSKKEDE